MRSWLVVTAFISSYMVSTSIENPLYGHILVFVNVVYLLFAGRFCNVKPGGNSGYYRIE